MATDEAQPLRIRCETLFDGDELHRRRTVRVEGDRIVSVEPTGAAEGDGPELDCRFLMPGLIDSHAHVAGYHEGSPAGIPFQPMKSFMRLLIYNGVTTVRDTGNSIESILYLREWGEAFAGPRIFGSGPLLDLPPLMWPFSRIVRDPQQARAQVRLLALEGMDFVKAYRNIPPDVLDAVVDEAREHGLDVAADIRATPALAASRSGVRSIEHVANVTPGNGSAQSEAASGSGWALRWANLDPGSAAVRELAEELAANGTFVCPTLMVLHRLALFEEVYQDPYLDYMATVMPYHRYFKQMRTRIGRMIGKKFMDQYMSLPRLSKRQEEEIRRGLAHMRRVMAVLHRCGVPLVAGTDSPNPSLAPGFSLHQELALMVEAGLSPLEVLRCATANAGDLLRQPGLGRLCPGSPADLLLLDDNPVEDIRNSQRIRGVIKAGRRVDRQRAMRLVMTPEDTAKEGGSPWRRS